MYSTSFYFLFSLFFLEVVNGFVSRKVENEGEFAEVEVAFCAACFAWILFWVLLWNQPAS